MRLFVAVELPEELRMGLADLLDRLRAGLPRARWVRAENLHITLAFLGEVDAGVPDELQGLLSNAAATLRPVPVHMAGGGFFPSPQRPRVAWLGGRAPGLAAWATAVAEAVEQVGVAPERRSFSLHLTLARLKTPWPPPEVSRFLELVDGWQGPPFTAREMTLFSSELRPGGPRYTALGRWPAAAGG